MHNDIVSAGGIEKNGGVLEDKRVDPGDMQLTRNIGLHYKVLFA